MTKPYYYDRVQLGGPTRRRSHRLLWTLLAAAFIILGALLAQPAHATETGGEGLVRGTCPNLTGWPDREDEVYPKVTAGGLEFGDKTNIHHAIAPLDLADVRPGSFTATGPADDQLLMKLETDTPYATIVVTSDGKFWSSKIPADQPGGQSHPVAAAVDLVGLAALPGKTLTANTHVVTVGLGVGNGPGAGRLVSSVTFHGHRYDLTCEPTPSSSSPSPASSSASPKPSKTSGTPKPHGSSSSPGAGAVAGGSNGGALAITGSSTDLIVGLGAVAMALGGVALFAVRRRRTRFIP